MAKGKKSPTPKGLSPEPVLDETALAKAQDLKSAATKLFTESDYARALDSYESAIKLLPPGNALRTDLALSKAACLMFLDKFKESAKECSAVLEGAPGNVRALRSRSKALERQGLYKQALADIQAVNRSESASPETREAEKRLKDLMAGRRPSLAAGGARAAAGGGAAAAAGAAGRGARSPMQYPFSAKVTLGGETRLVHLTASAGYADLMAAVSRQFPNAGPVVARFTDRSGDQVTITSRSDLQAALAEALAGMDRRLGLAGIPPIRVSLTQVDKSEVPPIPLEEASEVQQRLMAAHQQQQQQMAAAAQAAAPKQVATAQPSGEVIEVDDWLVDLIGLVKDASGVDADKHIEPLNDGFLALQRAVDTTVRSDEAVGLFDQAAGRFQEVAALGFVQWGNVHLYKAHRETDLAVLAGAGVSAELAARVAAECASAEALYRRALDVKADSLDALLALATLEGDRAKFVARLLPKPVAVVEGEARAAAAEAGASDEEGDKAAAAATLAATKEALGKVEAADVKAAAAHMAAAQGWFKQALAAAGTVDEGRTATKDARAAKQGKGEAAANGTSTSNGNGAAAAEGDEQLSSLSAHAQVLHGNALYEWSQVLAAVGDASWRSVLDEASALFRAAGCAEGDIRDALKNHTQVEHLDLGPDPEPEPAAAAAAAAAAPAVQQTAAAPPLKAAPEAKGLPKLDRKPAKEKAPAA